LPETLWLEQQLKRRKSMLKLYYYSKSDLRYKAVGRVKLTMALISIVLSTSFATMLSGYLGVDFLGLKSLRSDRLENAVLRAQLASLDDKLSNFQKVLEELAQSDDQLRMSVNLPKLSAGIRQVAVGGVETNRDYGVSESANKLIANAVASLEKLERTAKLQELSYQSILDKYKQNQKLFAHLPAIDPLEGRGVITDGFGMRMHPILHIRLMHEGIDLECETGTPVYATGDGEVSYVGRRGGYGLVVEIDHGFGYSTLYGHLEKSLVAEGQKVKRGQKIALSGESGLVTGPHLHYEVVKDGIHVDPTGYFFDGREYYSINYGELAKE
jgi:murein DD-endopeptidase MepM/ murein hydrolase activator NlpD